MLHLDRISKTFNAGTPNEKKALSGLSLHVAPGEFVTIVGSNGAGKSTLFNAISGSFYVDDGSITLGGRDITFIRNGVSREGTVTAVNGDGSLSVDTEEGPVVLDSGEISVRLR